MMRMITTFYGVKIFPLDLRLEVLSAQSSDMILLQLSHLFEHSFHPAALTVWNSLPYSIHNMDSIFASFNSKINLKLIFFFLLCLCACPDLGLCACFLPVFVDDANIYIQLGVKMCLFSKKGPILILKWKLRQCVQTFFHDCSYQCTLLQLAFLTLIA